MSWIEEVKKILLTPIDWIQGARTAKDCSMSPLPYYLTEPCAEKLAEELHQLFPQPSTDEALREGASIKSLEEIRAEASLTDKELNDSFATWACGEPGGTKTSRSFSLDYGEVRRLADKATNKVLTLLQQRVEEAKKQERNKAWEMLWNAVEETDDNFPDNWIDDNNGAKAHITHTKLCILRQALSDNKEGE